MFPLNNDCLSGAELQGYVLELYGRSLFPRFSPEQNCASPSKLNLWTMKFLGFFPSSFYTWVISELEITWEPLVSGGVFNNTK